MTGPFDVHAAECGFDDCDFAREGVLAELEVELHMANDHGLPWEEIEGYPRPPEAR